MTPTVSFEFFPPRTPESELRMIATLERLAPLQPAFISVTCGAGGSGTEVTLGAIRTLIARTSVPIAGHLTCVGRSRPEADAEALRYWEAGVRHIVALRGDGEVPGAPFQPHPEGYASSTELVAGVRRLAPFEVSVAAYPEPHPHSVSPDDDLQVLARKADAGATRALLQFSYDTDAIIALRDRIAHANLALKVVPGILLASDHGAITRMADRCGATVPDWVGERFAGLDDEPETRRLTAAIIAAEQVQRLHDAGFSDFHFYTLNQFELATVVCRALGVHPAPQPAVAA